jgi:hypothetical protein
MYWNILTMHGPMNFKCPNNISKWQMGFNSAFKVLNKNECPSQSPTKQRKSPLQKTRHNTKHKTRVTRKKGPKHPYDNWVAMRGEIEQAAVGRRALIKAIADFIKAVLPDTTAALTESSYTKKRVSRVRYSDCSTSDNATTACSTSLNIFCGRRCFWNRDKCR